MTWHDALWWALAAVCLRAVAANALWLARGNGPDGRWNSAMARMVLWLAEPRFTTALRLGFFLGVPVAALAARVVTPRQLGLAAPRPLGSAALALGLGAAATALVWGSAEWLRPDGARRARTSAQLLPLVQRVLGDSLLRETHWAFLRACLLTLGSANPTANVAAAVGLAAAEAWADPARRARMTEPGPSGASSQVAAMAIVSAYAFLATGSSFLAWAIQVAMGTVLARFYRAEADRPESPAPTVTEPTVI
jgi:hypothetical protein